MSTYNSLKVPEAQAILDQINTTKANNKKIIHDTDAADPTSIIGHTPPWFTVKPTGDSINLTVRITMEPLVMEALAATKGVQDDLIAAIIQVIPPGIPLKPEEISRQARQILDLVLGLEIQNNKEAESSLNFTVTFHLNTGTPAIKSVAFELTVKGKFYIVDKKNAFTDNNEFIANVNLTSNSAAIPTFLTLAKTKIITKEGPGIVTADGTWKIGEKVEEGRSHDYTMTLTATGEPEGGEVAATVSIDLKSYAASILTETITILAVTSVELKITPTFAASEGSPGISPPPSGRGG